MAGINDLQFYIMPMAIFSVSPLERCCFYSDLSGAGCVRHGRHLGVVYPKLEDLIVVVCRVAELSVFMTISWFGEKNFVVF